MTTIDSLRRRRPVRQCWTLPDGGIRLDPELRYLSDRSRSQLNVEYLVNDQETGEARGVIDWRHVTRFAPRTRLLIDATDVSDNDYFEDFGVGFEGVYVDANAISPARMRRFRPRSDDSSRPG